MMLRARLAALWDKDVRRLLGGAAFIFSCRIFASAVTFVTTLLLARWMGAAELGAYALAFSWLIMLAVFPASGYADAAIRFVGHGLARGDHGYVRGFIRHSTKVVILSSAALAAVGIAIVLSVPDFSSKTRVVFLLALAGVPFFAWLRLDTGVANAASRFALCFMPNNVFRSILFLVGVWLVWLLPYELEARSVMAIQLAAIVAVTIPTTILVRRPTMKHAASVPSSSESGLWARTAFSLLGLILFTNYFQQITVIGIGFFLPSADIGVYSVTYQIAMLISFGLIAVDSFVAPALARHFSRDERTELIRVIRHATQMRVIFAALGVALFIVLGDRILGLFGEEFVEGHTVMIILGLSQVSFAAVGPVARLLGVSGLHRQGLNASIGAVLLWMLLTAVLLPLFGLTGVAIAVFLSWTAWSAALRHLVIRHMGVDTLLRARDLRD